MTQIQNQGTAAAKPRGRSDKPRISERIARAIHRGRFVFSSILGAAAVLLLGYFIYNAVDTNRRERATKLVEEAAKQFDTWKAEAAGEKKDSARKELSDRLDLIVRKYPRQYAAQRARLVRATVLTTEEKWEQAAQEYTALADAYPSSYFAPIALFDAAVAMENGKNQTAAIDTYGRLIQRYPKSYLTPHALYSRGRLHEAAGETDKAKADYTTLSDNHSTSSWTRLGKNRILALEIKGR
jgi:tetratricopeptide (TPR) repeat protein